MSPKQGKVMGKEEQGLWPLLLPGKKTHSTLEAVWTWWLLVLLTFSPSTPGFAGNLTHLKGKWSLLTYCHQGCRLASHLSLTSQL